MAAAFVLATVGGVLHGLASDGWSTVSGGTPHATHLGLWALFFYLMALALLMGGRG